MTNILRRRSKLERLTRRLRRKHVALNETGAMYLAIRLKPVLDMSEHVHTSLNDYIDGGTADHLRRAREVAEQITKHIDGMLEL